MFLCDTFLFWNPLNPPKYQPPVQHHWRNLACVFRPLPIDSKLCPESTFYSINHRGNHLKTFFSLVVAEFRVPLYYHLPKILKSIVNQPGRPIIAGISSLTSLLSQYIAIFFTKICGTTQLVLKDSVSLIKLLKGIQRQPNYKWNTLDMTALYSNIPYERRLLLIKDYQDGDPFMPRTQNNLILEQFISL